MKLRKMIILFLLLFVIVLEPSFSAYAKEGDQYYLQLSFQQAKAVEAFQKLCDSFEKDSNGLLIYPDCYCGAWVDDDNFLVIALTSITDEDIITFENSYYSSDIIKFKQLSFSYNELNQERKKAFSLLSERGFQVYSSYIDQINNCICFEISESDYYSLSTESISEYPIFFKPSSSAELCTLLKGGQRIKNTTTNGKFTVSACGTYLGNNSILTCGHSYQGQNDYICYGTNGSTIGYVSYHRFWNYSYGDFEIIKITNSDFSISSTILSNNTIIGYNTYVPVNSIVYYYGASTQYTSWGVVDQIDVTQYFSPTNYNVEGLQRIKVTYGSCSAGDSGAPIYTSSNSGVLFSGVLTGDLYDNGYLYVYFTPYGPINAAGFYVQTN